MADALLGVALLVALATPPSTDDVSRAKAAEARAFEAIDDERWCEAMHAFMAANEAAPSVDLIYNAAQAADLAEDRKQALKLYVELIGAYPGSARQAEVNGRVQELTALVASEGEGTTCAPPAPAPPEPREEPPVVEETPAPPPASAEPALAPTVLPWAVIGAGALVTTTGVVLAAVGAVPYVSFLDVREQILAAEAAGTDASALQRQQTDHRASWESWGEVTTWSGVVAAVTGALVTTAGVVWLLSAGEDLDEGVTP